MGRFVLEHLPRNPARYEVAPLSLSEVRAWIERGAFHSLVRTTELITAVEAGMGIALQQEDATMALQPGDEAILLSLSFGVLLAFTAGGIPPLPEDWRCAHLVVEGPAEAIPVAAHAMDDLDLSLS